MRKIAFGFLAFVLLFAIPVPVLAQERLLWQQHSIEIEVECLDAAAEIIRGLNGYNLESNMFLHESPRDRGFQRSAFFLRRVDHFAFTHVQEALRDLGEVRFETENAHFLGAQIVDLDARLVALTEEIERLSIMMAASESLDVLIAIDVRLSQVTWDRNNVIGARNVLVSQVSNPIISISLIEATGERPPVVRPGFGSRVADSFTGSLRTTGTVAGNFLVFTARVFVPLLIYVLLAVLFIRVCIKIKRKQANKPVLAIASAPLVGFSMDDTAAPVAVADDNNEEGEV